jgi:CSLREA domain-containing protein
MQRSTYFRAFTLLAMLAALLSAALIAYGTALAQVNTTNIITVNTTADDATVNGNCTIREAIQAANSNAAVDRCAAGSATGQDTIFFANGLTGKKILLNTLLPNVTDNKGLVIDGRTNAITLSGNKKTAILLVSSPGQLTLRNLTLADAKSPQGSAVSNGIGTSLEVIHSTFTGNIANIGGGAISNSGLLNVTNSTFTANSTVGFAGAGGVGGAILNSDTLQVTNSTFSRNSAPQGQGGAIDNNHNNTVMSVVNSTFSGNSANIGGGIANLGQIFLTNDTFSGNSAAPNNGGAIGNFDTTSRAKLLNTIVANSPSGGNCGGDNGAPPINDAGFNISSDRSCRFIQPTSKNNTNPKLAASLANNGGPTRTIALLKGSPALNAIPKDASRCAPARPPLTTDQRGVKRPQGKGCDIGAYEKVLAK